MLYLLAAIGAICVAVLLWRAFVANPTAVSQRRPDTRPGTRPGNRPGTRPTRPGPLAPDDDPDFLRSIGDKKPPTDPDSKPPA